MADPVRVFISYSSKDANLVDRLKTALRPAQAQPGPTAATPRTADTGRAGGAAAPRASARGSSYSAPPGRDGTAPEVAWRVW